MSDEDTDKGEGVDDHADLKRQYRKKVAAVAGYRKMHEDLLDMADDLAEVLRDALDFMRVHGDGGDRHLSIVSRAEILLERYDDPKPEGGES